MSEEEPPTAYDSAAAGPPAGEPSPETVSGGAFLVISDPGGDPWEEGRFSSREQAQTYIESQLDDIAAIGLDPGEWWPYFRIERELGELLERIRRRPKVTGPGSAELIREDRDRR